MVWLKDKFTEGLGATELPRDKKIKNKYSSLQQAFKEAYKYI